MNYSDEEIVTAIRQGDDHRVMEFLYKKVLPNVINLICKNNGSKEDAHDVFQDAILIFYRQVIERTFNDKYKIRGYIYTISKNLWINKCKKSNREVLTSEDPEIALDADILSNIIQEEKTSLLHRLFSGMGEKCIELLTFSVYHKYSMKEIAEKMGFSNEHAAKTANYRCKQKLMEMVKESKFSEELLN